MVRACAAAPGEASAGAPLLVATEAAARGAGAEGEFGGALALARRASGVESAGGGAAACGGARSLAAARREMLALAGLLPAVSSGGGGGGRGGAASAGVVTGPRGTARPCGGAEEVLRARASARGGRLRALQARVRFEVQAEDHLFASAKSAPNRLVEWRSHALSDGGAQRCRNARGKDAVRRAHESGPAGERIVWATPEERAAAVLASAERDLAFCAREGAQRAREFGALQQALAAAREDKIRRRHAFLSEVLLRQRQLEEASFRAARMQRARNEGVLKWHSSVLNRKGRAERARIQALKADDYESSSRMPRTTSSRS
eukprot:PRCOL_00001824-RA